MDLQNSVEAAKEGAKALTKLGEILQKIFNPQWTRKQADADAYADARKLQTIRENPDMEIVYIGDEMHARERTPEALMRRAESRMVADAIRQEKNIENVLDAAASELKNADNVSDLPVDEDWIARLFSIIKEINNEGLQYVWGKILAGEITTPGSFSMRTLETVRNLSQKEAETFQKVLPLVMCSGGLYFITANEDLLKQYDLFFSDILLLEECGLVNMSLTNNPKVSTTENSLMYSDTTLIRFVGYTPERVQITYGVHKLSCAGKELYSILSHNSDKSYAIRWAEKIFDENKAAAKVFLYDVNYITDTAINHDTEPFQSFEKELENIE